MKKIIVFSILILLAIAASKVSRTKDRINLVWCDVTVNGIGTKEQLGSLRKASSTGGDIFLQDTPNGAFVSGSRLEYKGEPIARATGKNNLESHWVDPHPEDPKKLYGLKVKDILQKFGAGRLSETRSELAYPLEESERQACGREIIVSWHQDPDHWCSYLDCYVSSFTIHWLPTNALSRGT